VVAVGIGGDYSDLLTGGRLSAEIAFRRSVGSSQISVYTESSSPYRPPVPTTGVIAVVLVLDGDLCFRSPPTIIESHIHRPSGRVVIMAADPIREGFSSAVQVVLEIVPIRELDVERRAVGHVEESPLRPTDLPSGLPGVQTLEAAAVGDGHGNSPSEDCDLQVDYDLSAGKSLYLSRRWAGTPPGAVRRRKGKMYQQEGQVRRKPWGT